METNVLNSPRSPVYVSYREAGGEALIEVSGVWRIVHAQDVRRELNQINLNPRSRVAIDGGKLEQIDTSGAMLLFQLFICCGLDPARVKFVNFSEDHLEIINLVKDRVKVSESIRNPESLSYVESIGQGTIEVGKKFKDFLAFLGEVLIEGFAALRRPKELRITEIFVQLEQVCLNAVPVVCMVTFLIGVVVAYLFADQIKRYGGNIFIVDGVSIAMFRELSPIIVAIIIAGRSGSAFTAQIGTMKLNEEIDAMRALGVLPLHVLVLPRIIALVIAMPLLVFVGDILGILGGMVIADAQLGITTATFIERLHSVIPVKHSIVGFVKAPVFAAFIAIIGCRMGLAVENNARSVGINTTSTVVQSIVSVILLNAGFAVILVEMGI